MIIRDGKGTGNWVALRCALRGRDPKFELRESLPKASLAWDVDHLPRVLVSEDVYRELERQVPQAFADSVLSSIRTWEARCQ